MKQRCDWELINLLVLVIGILALSGSTSAEEIARMVPLATATVDSNSALFFTANGLGYPVMERVILQGQDQKLIGMYYWLDR